MVNVYIEPKMQGAYSNIANRKIQIITEKEISNDGYIPYVFDAPVYSEVEQDEFTPEMATETNEFC